MSGPDRDQALMRRVQTGDERALAELYDRHSGLLYSLALRILRRADDAEDALQETWLQAWRNAAGYDARRGTVAAWLLTMCRSRALDRVRARASRDRAETAAEVEPRTPPPPASAAAEARERHERVSAALAQLTEEQRRVLEIAYFEGLSQSEVAARLNTPLGTVKSWTRQGLKRLREVLPKGEPV